MGGCVVLADAGVVGVRAGVVGMSGSAVAVRTRLEAVGARVAAINPCLGAMGGGVVTDGLASGTIVWQFEHATASMGTSAPQPEQ